MHTYEAVLTGVVQGVGFRPFVARMAKERNLCGTVKNTGADVRIKVNMQSEQAMEEFLHCLVFHKPEGSKIDRIEKKEVPFCAFDSFDVIHSTEGSTDAPDVPVDMATCEFCKKEMETEGNRRYRYPFISCTNCGPRYSIMESLPYDRPNTSMKQFPLCRDCEEEYVSLDKERAYAQTICCPDCGPQLYFRVRDEEGLKNQAKDSSEGKRKEYSENRMNEYSGSQAYEAALKAIQRGKIIAVKDIGGFHLVCDPTDAQAVKNLRKLKHREAKAFAVMFGDLAAIEEKAFVSEKEKTLLQSNARPIVLVKKKKAVYPGVCDDSDDIGAMLPSNPLQMMLTRDLGPLIMTSGNASGEMICREEEKMLAWQKKNKRLYGVLWNDREIVTPLDDSVMRISLDTERMLRRARGFVPEAILLGNTRILGETNAKQTEVKQTNAKQKETASRKMSPYFCAGGDLKSCFSYVCGHKVYLSQHFGDLGEENSLEAYKEAAMHMKKILRLEKPEIVAVDGHPGYFSGQLAKELFPAAKIIKIQHHHAHAASVMAENNLEGPVIAVSMDGTGYGMDGTIWGGEFLLCDGPKMKRVGTIKGIEMPAGDRAAVHTDLALDAWYMAAGYPECVKERLIAAAIKNHMHTVKVSSMGRLFDVMACLLGLGNVNRYEGECAMALERLAKRGKTGISYDCPIALEDGLWTADTVSLFRQMKESVEEGEAPEEMALGFHKAVIDFTVSMCSQLCQEYGVNRVVLSGGTFQNQILFSGVVKSLRERGILVYWNEKVPGGDGGLALGQAYIIEKMFVSIDTLEEI